MLAPENGNRELVCSWVEVPKHRIFCKTPCIVRSRIAGLYPGAENKVCGQAGEASLAASPAPGY